MHLSDSFDFTAKKVGVTISSADITEPSVSSAIPEKGGLSSL